MTLKKIMASALSAALCCFALVGCAGQSSDSSSGNEQLEDKLVIYSTHPEALLQEVADDFTAETGVPVEFINLKGGLADRVLSEKDNPQADIMYGGSTTTFTELAKQGCYEKTNPSWAKELDSNFKDKDGQWYATIQTPVVMFYNTEMMSEADAPKNYNDLADSKYADQVVTRDNASSSQREWICAMIYANSKDGNMDKANEWLKGLASNTKNYYNSSSMMFKAIGNKEAAIGVSTLNDVQKNIEKNGMPLKAIDSSDGNVISVDCVAALKNAPHSKAAAKFVEFCGTAKEQAKIANSQSRIPTLKSALKDSPEWMQKEMKMLDVDTATIASHQSEWLDLWNNTAYDTSKVVEAEKK